MRVRDIDESELIRRFVDVLPTGARTILGSGDDCAVLAAPEGQIIVSSDVLVEHVDFVREWSTARQIGQRAAAQNLADIAAMGGRPSSFIVSMTLPEDEDVEWVVDLVTGFGERVAAAGGGVDGGDLSSGTCVMLSVAALGWCEGVPVTRSGAQAGDVVALAGTLGRSAAGLELLHGKHVDPWLHSHEELGDLYEAVSIFRSPRPPLEAGPEALAAGAHAMLDLSDGLAKDARRIARASGVIIDIDQEALREDVDALAAPAGLTGIDPMQWIIAGGEDHSLFATFEDESCVPDSFRIIGRVRAVEKEERPTAFLDGVELRGGWDHFRQE